MPEGVDCWSWRRLLPAAALWDYLFVVGSQISPVFLRRGGAAFVEGSCSPFFICALLTAPTIACSQKPAMLTPFSLANGFIIAARVSAIGMVNHWPLVLGYIRFER